MKELFPLNTFQQDAVLKRMNELLEASKDIVDGSEHLFENITDSQGHKRFIEGDIDLTQEITGIQKLYGKWSLSGSHLLIVFCFTIANTTTLSWEGNFCTCKDMPKWLVDKIIPIVGSFVDDKSFKAFDENLNTQTFGSQLRKLANDAIVCSFGGGTASADRVCRFAFDLLIDNVEPVNP